MTENIMLRRQLASTVRQGKKITVSILDEDLLGGYLAGMDDEAIFVLAPFNDDNGPYFNKVLVPWSAILYIQIHDDKTFMDEPLYHEMERVASSFKTYVNKTYFQRETSEPSASPSTKRR